MKAALAIALGAIAVIGLAPFGSFFREAPPAAQEDKRPHVETARAARKTVYRKLSLPGELLPNQQAAIYARVQGYLESIPADRGSIVKAGDTLAKISVPELEKQLAKERADLATSAPSIARDAAGLAWREAMWRRLDEAAKKTPDLVNAEALDDLRGRYETAKAELELTRAKEHGMRAAVERTQATLDFATLRAPFDGVVTERWADPGDLVQPAATKLLHLMQVDPVRVRIHVSEPDVPGVRADSRAKMTFDGLPGRTIEAPVARSFWALNKSTKTMAVEIDLKNAEGVLRPGMFARVTVELEARPGALVLPASALVTEKKKSSVFVVKEGVARKVAIKVGFDDGIEFEAREGITDQDDVIVTGKNLVSEGEAVRATPRR